LHKRGSQVRDVDDTVRLAPHLLPLNCPLVSLNGRVGKTFLNFKQLLLRSQPFHFTSPPNSTQQGKRYTNSRSQEPRPEDQEIGSASIRPRSGTSHQLRRQTGRGPEKLQAAPGSQVLVKARVPSTRGKNTGLLFPTSSPPRKHREGRSRTNTANNKPESFC
jgi:hypothetical protein